MATSGREWIAAHVPHQGAMSLLDEVVRWDFARLAARATGHRDAAHPLRRDGILPSVCAIEYGAQAVAAHGALPVLFVSGNPNVVRAGNLSFIVSGPRETLESVEPVLLAIGPSIHYVGDAEQARQLRHRDG